MANKKIYETILIFTGYLLSVIGGILGIVAGLFLLKMNGERTEKHGKMIMAASLGTILFLAFYSLNRLSILSMEILTPLLFVYFVVSALIGGYIAFKKEDYFTRGFFMTLFTGIWGISILIFASPSKAKENKKSDKHYWPRESWIALILMALNLMMIVFLGNLFHIDS
jgi:TctA family transporter